MSILNKLHEVKLITYKIFCFLFLAMFVWLFINCVMIEKVKYYDINDRLVFNPLLIIELSVIFIIGCVTLYRAKEIYKQLRNINKAQTMFFCGVVLIFIFTLQLTLGYALAVYPGWDFKNIFDAANSIVDNGIYNGDYFILFPTNLGMLVVEVYLFKFAKYMGLQNMLNIAILANCILVNLSIFIIFLIAKKIYGNFKACITLIFSALFIPFYFYMPIIYTDTFSMPFLLISFYLYLLIKENDKMYKKLILIILMTLISFIGYKIKSSALIILIAIIIHIILTTSFKNFIKLSTPIIVIFIILNNSFGWFLDKNAFFSYTYREVERKEVPYTHFIMMGLNEGTFGSFAGQDIEYTIKYLNGQENNELCKEKTIEMIKKRYFDFGIIGTFKYLTKKATWTWGDGLYLSDMQITDNPISYGVLHKSIIEKGSFRTAITYFAQVFQIILLFLMICSVLKDLISKNKEINILATAKISIFGIFLLLLVWETRSRYLFNFVPLFILVTVDGLEYFIQVVEKKFLIYKEGEKNID